MCKESWHAPQLLFTLVWLRSSISPSLRLTLPQLLQGPPGTAPPAMH